MKSFTVRLDDRLDEKLEEIRTKISSTIHGYKPSKNETIKILIEEFYEIGRKH
jgi:hypothetical protein